MHIILCISTRFPNIYMDSSIIISDNEKIFTFNVCLPSGNAVSRSDPADL
mgnify:CR=1 FL=1